MWSGPRNVSTAMMYSFHHRGDTLVVDEPFYSYYLKRTGIDHPGRTEILEAHESNQAKVIHSLCEHDYGKEILFMKNMPHHMGGVDMSFISSFQNFFLIREPRKMIASYIQKIPDVKMSDLGLDLQYELFLRLKEEGAEVPVIDSQVLLTDPGKVLRKLCASLGVPFHDAMLNWEPGAIPEDGIWAKYWYANVHASTGLGAPKASSEVILPKELESLAEACEYYYRELKKEEIKP